MGTGTTAAGTAAGAASRSGAPKFHCDNALTGSQSGLYCAPLAAKAARCGAAAGGPDEASASARAQDARSKKEVDGGKPMAILPAPFPRRTQQCVAVGARRDARDPPEPSACGCSLKIWQVICVGTR